MNSNVSQDINDVKFFNEDKLTALEAKQEAQRIAFAPFVFQAARSLRNLGILDAVGAAGDEGLALSEIRQRVSLSVYATRVLVEAGLGMGMLIVDGDRYRLTKLGWYLQNDHMTRVNMDFVHDVNYRGFCHLQESLVTGTPAGLRELAPGAGTIYEALGNLPSDVRKSWLDFDHFYSDGAFRSALPLVFDGDVASILDVGANTGKWAVACAEYAPDVRITLCDLPGQIVMLREHIEKHGLTHRVVECPMDILHPDTELPGGHDVIWMSQFLDCFSEDEIVAILKKAANAMTDKSRLFVMETYWDRQQFENAAFCLQQTSLYFTCMANGNSQMYHSSVMHACFEKAGLEVVAETDHVGIVHTVSKLMKRR